MNTLAKEKQIVAIAALAEARPERFMFPLQRA